MTSLVVVVSDLHCNSTVALCPPSINLDDGGTYRASKAQGWLWDNWLDFWQAAKQRRRNKRLYIVLNGDLVDGDHHDTPQIISRNMETQHRIAMAILGPALALDPDHIFIVRGTEAHTGKSAQWEEFLASDIGAEPDDDTNTGSWWWLPLQVDNVKFDFAHHGRMGVRPWTRSNAVQMMAAELVMRYAERGDPLPDVAVRSHKHQVADSGDNFPIRVLQTPSWQLSTAYGHKIAPGALLPVGGYMFTCKDGEYHLDKKIYKPQTRQYWDDRERVA